MGLVPEDRASARSGEPEARSAARWREHAGTGTLVKLAERWPALASCSLAVPWLEMQRDLGRSPRTIDAYARSLVDYVRFCERNDLDVVEAGRAEIARYVRDLRERPGRRGGNVVALDSGAGLSNATLQLRVTVVRLFYDFLVEERVRDRNPVGRGYRTGDGRSGRRGLIPRVEPLPWIPTDAQWRAVLDVAAGDSLRNRLMLALAYDAALRREELCLLATDDLDPAHRTITIRVETTKTRRSRVVPYSAVAGRLLAGYLAHRRQITSSRGSLFVSESPRNRGEAITAWTWSKVVRSIAVRAGVPTFSTHTLRHLCLTDLARSGWELHQIATFAGHQRTQTTLRYIHLSGRDLAERVESGMSQIPRRPDRADQRGALMTAHSAVLRVEPFTPAGPSGIAGYDRRTELSVAERDALASVSASKHRWPADAAVTLARLTDPVDDVLAFVTPQAVWWGRSPTRTAMLAGIATQNMTFWGWDRDQWLRVLRATQANIRQVVAAVGYLLCDHRDLHHDLPGFKLGLFARRVFGADPVDAALERVQSHLDRLGSSALLRRPNLQHALYRLMIAAGSAQLEHCAQAQLLVQMRERERNNARRHGIEQLARTLVDIGVLVSLPFATQPSREDWLDRSRAGEIDVPAEWLDWVRRWFATATLATQSRQATYFMLIKAGRWITHEAPELADPGTWTRQSAARWVARVDRLRVGEFSHAPNTDYMRRRHGETLSPRTKASQIWALRRFFYDLHEWEWIDRRFDPRRAFEIPRSLRALIGPDPRVISDEIWAKLMWAGLNLQPEDLPSHGQNGAEPWYPLELVRAVAMLWLFAGLRTDEIYRLRVGAIRWQTDPASIEQPAVCLLDVPVNKTGTPFTKPVDRIVGDAIEAWEQTRPPQPRFPDRKTGQLVEFLFTFRGARIGEKYVNRVLIPMLSRKAGVPRQDVRGRITGHRARATIASQLYNAKDPMTLFELQAWLGHSSPHSTQHYARITPTKLTKAYTDAGYFARNVRTIEVLLDRDAITNGQAGQGGPFEFYDLGHGYCTYSFFEQCPHRMACARCDFYLPKPSSEAQLIEAKDGIQRMLVQIPLTDEERAAAETDEQAVGRLIDLLTDTPTPTGATPRQLASFTPQPAAPPAPSDADLREGRCDE